jgi:hypothetical protein
MNDDEMALLTAHSEHVMVVVVKDAFSWLESFYASKLESYDGAFHPILVDFPLVFLLLGSSARSQFFLRGKNGDLPSSPRGVTFPKK